MLFGIQRAFKKAAKIAKNIAIFLKTGKNFYISGIKCIKILAYLCT